MISPIRSPYDRIPDSAVAYFETARSERQATSFVGAVKDITERKAREEREQLLMRENAASAQAIGLALHELTTNAGKYGALSAVKGRVDIF